jgi:hypothetical protein
MISDTNVKLLQVVKKRTLKTDLPFAHIRGTPDTNHGNHRLWNREQTPPQPSGLKGLVL